MATILIPLSSSNLAVFDPTFPKPCTAQVALLGFILNFCMAAKVLTMMPLPVASVRPKEPPSTNGLPVTTAKVVCPLVFENSSISQAISVALVPMSGAGISLSGPKISAMDRV